MNMTKEQKTLKTFSTIELIAAIINIAFAGVMFFSGGGEAEAIGEGIGSLISAVICLVVWNALKKVAEDARQYKTARTLVTIGLVFSVLGLIACVATGDYSTLATNVLSLVIDGYVLSLINKVKATVA